MFLPHYSERYEKWAPIVGRSLFGLLFLFAAFAKIPGTASYTAETGMTANAGVPLPSIAVILAFILEAITGIALIIGWKTRTVAFVLAPYILLLALIFYSNFKDPMQIGMFVNHLALIAGLLYISVYDKKR